MNPTKGYENMPMSLVIDIKELADMARKAESNRGFPEEAKRYVGRMLMDRLAKADSDASNRIEIFDAVYYRNDDKLYPVLKALANLGYNVYIDEKMSERHYMEAGL